MTISLDGFVADQNGNAGRLYPDLAALRHTAYSKDAIEQTGAVLMGRRTFEMADPDSYVDNYEFQVPIFVLTHHPPRVAPTRHKRLTFTFVTDGVESAVAKAKAAAKAGTDASRNATSKDKDKGDKAVQVVGGASLAQQLLEAGRLRCARKTPTARLFDFELWVEDSETKEKGARDRTLRPEEERHGGHRRGPLPT
jgi:dihydrofolate reductase